MNLDLHLHSTASDGAVSPAEVVSAAVDARLDAIALTDHDTLAGVLPAMEAARGRRVEIIPAIEVSTTWDDVELHILGYFVDPSDRDLLEHTGRAAEQREARLVGMVDRLREQGIDVPFDRVRAASTGERPTLGRPHLARALVEIGVVDSIPEAFDRYIGNDHPAYIPTRLLDPERAIRLIHGAGGVALWAHPPGYRVDALLPELKAKGLDGIEVYRPRMPRDRVLRFEALARQEALLVSGGSDWHGPQDGPLGEFRVQGSEVADLLAAGGM